MSFLQIASWNIEHLSGSSREDKAQSAYALADHIEMAGVDILALQEIYVTDDSGDWRNDELDRVCELLEEHLGDAWAYKIYPNRDPSDRSQLCALMWNTARVEKTGEMVIPVPHKDGDLRLWDRAPQAVQFTMLMDVWHKDADGAWHKSEAAKSLVVVPLHMKSNWGGASKNIRIRAKEAEVLCAAMDTVRTKLDPSIVLIGDTNVLKYDEPAIETFVTSGFDDLNNNDGATYWSKQYGESPFDRAFVASGRPEFRYSRQYVLRSSDLVQHDRFLSDHYMIKMSVKLYLDDTDPRDHA